VQRDNERARTLYLDAANVARACGDTESLAIVAHNLGLVFYEEDALESAPTHLQQALELYGELAEAAGEASAMSILAVVALAEGDIDEAAAFLVSSLRLAKRLGKKEQVNRCLVVSASPRRLQGTFPNTGPGKAARATRPLRLRLRGERRFSPS
jgi:tetratricopeptide (TPR) repeat protein